MDSVRSVERDIERCKELYEETQAYIKQTTAMVHAHLAEVEKLQANLAKDQERLSAILESLSEPKVAPPCSASTSRETRLRFGIALQQQAAEEAYALRQTSNDDLESTTSL